MTGEQENDLLRSVYEQLGLMLGFSPRRGYVVYDSDLNEYACFTEGGVESSLCAPDDVKGFLKVSYFEHYKYPNDYKVIHNPFYGMSQEEVELRLAVTGVQLNGRKRTWSGRRCSQLMMEKPVVTTTMSHSSKSLPRSCMRFRRR